MCEKGYIVNEDATVSVYIFKEWGEALYMHDPAMGEKWNLDSNRGE